MSEPHNEKHIFTCRLVWTGAEKGTITDYETYSREHRVEFDGKPALVASAAPPFRGDPSLHNPEDLLMAALTCCHFLSYVAFCARSGVHVIDYEDRATGTMEKVDRVVRFTEVVLRPRVTITPGSDLMKARALHARAHASCFIANSVNFPVRHEPVIEVATVVGG